MTRWGSTSHSFFLKVTSGQVTEENVTPLIHFYGKILHYRVYSIIEIEDVRIILDLTKFLCYDQAYHPSRIHRDNPGLELTVPVADEYLTGTLKCPVL